MNIQDTITNVVTEEEAEALLAALTDNGYVILPQEPTARMLFCTRTEWPFVSLGVIWEEMTEQFRDDEVYN